MNHGTHRPQNVPKIGFVKSSIASGSSGGQSPHTTGINVDTCAGVAHCETASTAAETSAGR